MPTPLSLPQLETAVENALVSVGAIPSQLEAVAALTEAGVTIPRLSTELANLIYTAKDSTKLKAILHAFQIHGVNLNQESDNSRTVNIQFNVVSENTQLNNLFAPERK